MDTSRDAVARRYGEHLTDRDLLALTGDRPDQVDALRRRPELILDLLDRPAVADAVLTATRDEGERFRYVSPFLVFAAAAHRASASLVGHTSVLDRTAPRSRIPILDGPVIAAFAADPAHRLFLAELLASYARLASGVVWRRDDRGWHRRRWDELDLPRLAELVADVPPEERAGIWRRIGDGALFLAGVYPEYAERAYGATGTARLQRTTGLALRGEGPVGELLEDLAGRAYRQTHGAVPPGVVESPSSARRLLTIIADRYLHRDAVVGPS
ncbi:hypothetical protein LQ327_20120 [Actinomycetospora endophytica]|uniref:Nucleotidyltransferase-like protein n=1 Tax=Actinomycetospora endophytica TaxID=2291215 RepID=A0ABS8PDY6_9PSEU|nr:hypothetical protein [Actinomycetospora endophytica]MCD2195680.1 hypothetical protein [Actinomycetospora endophytica]